MFKFSQQEKSVILFLIAMIIIGGGLKVANQFYPQLFSRIGSPGREVEIPPRERKAKSAATKIDINRDDSTELETLPYIGPKRAAAIIKYRKEHGPFQAISQIQKIHGIGEKTFERLRDSITVGEVSGTRRAKPGKIHLNFATQKQLETLPRIGPERAKKIIEYRTAHGPFRSIRAITDIPGIGEKTFRNLKDKITVEKRDINAVTKEELEDLIGPEKAEAIIAYRRAKGPFRKMRMLRKISYLDYGCYKYLKRLYTTRNLKDKITVEKKDINVVTKEELEALIGSEKAGAIIAYRRAKGPFRKMRMLRKISYMDYGCYKYLKRLYTTRKKG